MNVATITMDPEQAKAKLKAFRADKHKDAEIVYRQCAEAYEQLAKGRTLIELSKAIQGGGFFPEMRPKLAVAPADAKEVEFIWPGGDTSATFRTLKPKTRRVVRELPVPLGREHGLTREWNNRSWPKFISGYAMVPMVPADVRPRTGQLADWHVLWEVEHWADKSLTGRPPRDPFLLQHVAGDLWAVLAEWDLTDLERAVMANQQPRQPQ